MKFARELTHHQSAGSQCTSKRLHLILFFIFTFGLALRLPNLKIPNSVVFDEVYWGQFANNYLTHKNFFDIHPPHTKLLITAVARMAGHRSGFAFANVGDRFDETVSAFGLRLVPAIAGSLLPVLVIVFLTQLGVGTLAAASGGMLLALDNAFWVQSRITALDPMLLVAFLGSLILMVHALRKSDMGARSLWLSLAGAAAGWAVGTKYTGLACVPLLGLLLLQATVQDRSQAPFRAALLFFRSGIWLAFGFVVVFLAGWYVHFQLLTLPGPGDSFYRLKHSFFEDLVRLQVIMLERNAEISAEHAYASKWFTWPTMRRPVYYWEANGGVIYFLGNPVVWYGALMGCALAVLSYAGAFCKHIVRHRSFPAIPLQVWLPFAACFFAFAPLMRVDRPLFLYHYLTTLMFSLIAWIVAFEYGLKIIALRWRPMQTHVWCAIVTLGFLGYFALLPMTSGAPVGKSYREFVYRYMPSWR